jgi:pyridoxamine 5'-phosphate oxidase family protein
MAVFTDIEYRYLVDLALGRLATIGPNGPQNHPVTYEVDAEAGVVDVGGPDLASTQKYRNLRAEARVSLVVDDNASEPVGPGGQRGRGLRFAVRSR